MRRLLLVLCASLPLALALIIFGWALLAIPPGAEVGIARGTLLVCSMVLALAALPVVLLALRRPAAAPNPAPIVSVEVLAPGLEPGDDMLVRALFPQSERVRLQPLAGGYSGAAVFQAHSWGEGGALQRSSVVKVGPAAKLHPEVENYDRYIREYVGNTATLLHHAQAGTRMALRWTYAAFTGENVETLTSYAAAGHPIAPVIEELFASRATMGLLLGSPRRDPQRALYA